MYAVMKQTYNQQDMRNNSRKSPLDYSSGVCFDLEK